MPWAIGTVRIKRSLHLKEADTADKLKSVLLNPASRAVVVEAAVTAKATVPGARRIDLILLKNVTVPTLSEPLNNGQWDYDGGGKHATASGVNVTSSYYISAFGPLTDHIPVVTTFRTTL